MSTTSGHMQPRSGHHQRDQQQGNAGQKGAAPKKESIINMVKYIDKSVRVKFQGGREATGILKGYDQLLNLVLDQTVEYFTREVDNKMTEEKRFLGLIVCRGPALIVVCPEDGHQSIANPFTDVE